MTGGAGYIGSHTCVELMGRGHHIVVLDNFANSTPAVIGRIEQVGGLPSCLVGGDVRDTELVCGVLRTHSIDAVIHFAALKAVGESWSIPLDYFDTNIGGTLSLLKAMRRCAVDYLVFSSSATVYGEAGHEAISENAPTSAVNPYARTKLVAEQMIGDLASSDQSFRPLVLRYFNPAGAHPSGMLGESPNGIPNNLFPFVSQTAAGLHDHVRIFGDDYPTVDGTGVRDYVHVMDLARAHVDGIELLMRGERGQTLNVGTGRGFSVLEIIETFRRISGKPIPARVYPRRDGDIATCFANTELALQALGWQAKLGLEEMCTDAWRWQLRQSGFFSLQPDR